MKRAAIVLFSLASIAAGIVNLVYGDFDKAHQPIQAFGDNVPGEHALAIAFAIALVAGGLALLAPRTEKGGAAVLAVVYLAFACFGLPRLFTAPAFLGQHLAVYAGVIAGVAQQAILVAAAIVLWMGDRATATARWIVGLSSIDFGLAHLTALAPTAQMVPSWMPFGAKFWVGLTGVAFLLAGIAVLIRRCDVLATRLLASMLFVFSGLALLPILLQYPRAHGAWGANAYNLAAVAAVWVFAEWLQERKERTT